MKTVNLVVLVLAVVSMTASAEIFSTNTTFGPGLKWQQRPDDGRGVGVSTILSGVTVTASGRQDFDAVVREDLNPGNGVACVLTINAGGVYDSTSGYVNLPDDFGPVEINIAGTWRMGLVYGKGDTRMGEILLLAGGKIDATQWFNTWETDPDVDNWKKDPMYWVYRGWVNAAPGCELVMNDTGVGTGTLTAVVPEPATLSILSLGVLALLRKRK